MAAKTFIGIKDRYNGITVTSQEEPCDQSEIKEQLLNSLKKWANEQRACIWFKVNIKDASWVPILADEGFNFHHARDDFVMMFKWLPLDRKANLPPACHTNIGVGAIVFNSKNQMLVVMEKHIEFANWKLPGGYVERGENLKDAAMREVKEETDVDSVFESLVSFRHTHGAMYGNSDIYFIVKLKATSDVIKKSDIEIKACQWMEVNEFLNHPDVHDFNRFIVKQALDLEKRQIKFDLQETTVKFATWVRNMTCLILEDIKRD